MPVSNPHSNLCRVNSHTVIPLLSTANTRRYAPTLRFANPFQVFNDHNERRVILILDVPRSDLGPGRWFLRVLNHVFLWGVSPLLPESSNIVANTAEFRRLVDTLAANTNGG